MGTWKGVGIECMGMGWNGNAKSIAGHLQREWLLVTATDRPEAPVDVRLRHCSATVAEVSWRAAADNNEPILDYTLEYDRSTDVWHEAAVVGAAAAATTPLLSAVVPLTPWSNYTFRVAARSRLGRGPASRPSDAVCTTPAAKPFRNPAGVCANLTSDSRLNIVWQVPPHFLLSCQRQSRQTILHVSK